ncbi:MAG: general secretion pathway protein GspF [Gammaproteobacteria bacterium]|nr:MAG: general secretion pathway protein GspF [Gammaproteobacteria bacterium]TLZ35211.1 MAG: general secretion pathway protein GspF [Gammaproteobacteria bacterium]
MLIRKKPPRSHALGEPLLHQNHPLPVTRRDFVAAGFLSGPAMVIGPAWLGALLKASRAEAGVPLSPDIQALLGSGQCNVPTAAGGLPFICFDLAGGANLVGSEVLVGVQGGQTNFLSTAGYGKLGVPGNMVPTSSANIDASLGLLWHADGAIKRGILSKATTPATAAGTNGAVICAMSQNDTQNNPHNPMYGIAKAGAQGLLLTLAGTESTVSGGNSQAPMALVDPALQPTTISQPSDATALVNTGGATADPVAVAVLESQARISGGTTPYQSGNTGSFGGALSAPNGSTPGVQLYSDPVTDTLLKNQVRCAYVKSANTAAVFGNPAALDPTQDPNIVGGTTPIFTASDFMDNDVQKTATVMKLVLDGFAGAGTITLGGYDYHDGTRATGEGRNFKAGQMIGAVLEYAQRVGKPVMIYVFSDGSLTSTGMVDSSTGGRGKLGWQGDNSSVASTFFLAYSPKGRPQLRNGTAGQQIGYFGSDGSVVSTSSPAANAVNQLVQVVILNYMGLLGTDAQFPTLFSTQSLGSASALAGLTAFARIV